MTEAGRVLHHHARFSRHSSYPERNRGVPIPDDKLAWDVAFPEYQPVSFTALVVLQNWPNGWADPPDVAQLGRKLSSHTGPLRYDKDGRPLNPMGRTGLAGRGVLGRWGPNFAADPIVTRDGGRPGLVEMLAIRRRDSGAWAIPGGMVDYGEEISETLAREFREEAGVDLDMQDAVELYRGYVDDPRNTDHAWMETIVKHKHLAPEFASKLQPKAGDDASEVCWMPLVPENIEALYASHSEFVRRALERIQNS